MTAAGDIIPIVELYRGVGIHDRQPAERVESVVKPAIDRVLAMADEHDLFAIAQDAAEPPEARLLAAAKITAAFEIAAEERRNRPEVGLAKVRAAVAGLNSQRWRDPWRYGSKLDAPKMQRMVEREQPLR